MRFPMRLNTPRLALREPRGEDAAAVWAAWAADTEVARFLALPPSPNLETTRARLAWDQARWTKKSAYTWLLLRQPGAAPVGQIQLIPQRLDGPAHHLRLGYLLARRHWGQGLMHEALATLLPQLWAEAGVWRIDAVCDLANPASSRLLDRLGFTREGLLRRHSLHPLAGSEPRDVWLHAALRDGPAAEPGSTGPAARP
jgi:ribosomal-protein-alanine N-acetyltransferase